MGTGLGLPGVPGTGSEGREQRSDPRSPTNLQRTGQLSLGSSRPRQCRPHVPQHWRDLLNSEKHQDNPTRCSWKGPRDDTSNHGPNAVGVQGGASPGGKSRGRRAGSVRDSWMGHEPGEASGIQLLPANQGAPQSKDIQCGDAGVTLRPLALLSRNS